MTDSATPLGPTQARLGDQTYDLKPQRIGRIGKRLTDVARLADLAVGGGITDDGLDVSAGVGPQLYAALEVFIPDLDPIHVLAGYRSAEDFAAKREHEETVDEAREQWAADRDAARLAYAQQLRSVIPDTLAAEIPEDDQRVPDESIGWDDLDDVEQAGFDFAAFEEPEFADPYDEKYDRSPRPPELIDAVDKIFQIHGGKRLTRLLENVVGLETIRSVLRAEILRWASGRSRSEP